MGLELNVDLGELPDEPEELYALATTVNVACGGHAGDDATMRRALDLAEAHGATVAAHPSYPDRAGFGRRARYSDATTTLASVEEQCRRLRAIAIGRGAEIRVVKAHGALYHDVAADPELAEALLTGAARALPELAAFVGWPDTRFEEAARVRGFTFLREGFADRRYDERFQLVPRSRPDALLTVPDDCVAQALMLVRRHAIDTLCIHGDTPSAVLLARVVRSRLEREGMVARR